MRLWAGMVIIGLFISIPALSNLICGLSSIGICSSTQNRLFLFHMLASLLVLGTVCSHLVGLHLTGR